MRWMQEDKKTVNFAGQAIVIPGEAPETDDEDECSETGGIILFFNNLDLHCIPIIIHSSTIFVGTVGLSILFF